MLDKYIFIIEIIGTIAFASSGAMVGIRKRMDIFGVCVLGFVTAVGGGMVRDVILGIVPPNVFRNPDYALVAVLTSLIGGIPNRLSITQLASKAGVPRKLPPARLSRTYLFQLEIPT